MSRVFGPEALLVVEAFPSGRAGTAGRCKIRSRPGGLPGHPRVERERSIRRYLGEENGSSESVEASSIGTSTIERVSTSPSAMCPCLMSSAEPGCGIGVVSAVVGSPLALPRYSGSSLELGAAMKGPILGVVFIRGSRARNP